MVAGWFVPDQPPQDVSTWRASLWLLLGMHFIDIYVETSIMTGQTVDAVEVFSGVPVTVLRLVPPVAIALGSFYAARKVSQTGRPRYVLINAASVIAGYFPALVIAFVVSDINPELETALVIVSVAALAIYVGSTLVARLTGGLPFFGIASLGTILLVGLIALVVAVEVLLTFGPALVISASGVGAGAVAVYYQRGGGIPDVLSFLRRNVTIILPFLLLAAGLYFVLGGPVPI